MNKDQVTKYRLRLLLSDNKRFEAKKIAEELNKLPIDKQEKIEIIREIVGVRILNEHHYSYEKRASANDEYLELLSLMLKEVNK